MQQRLIQYIQENNLFNIGTPILLACSGGVDSMVLADVLIKSGFKIGLAHCNFQLRGEDAHGDELFVKHVAEKHKLPFFSIRFDTQAYVEQHQVSIQMAARTLRYDWLEKIRKDNGFHQVVTAHHLDDNIETVLLNFIKGTGINGMVGMQAKRAYIVRPMVTITKETIVEYAKVNQIAYREDSSNASDKYQRNFIRHHIIPLFKEINNEFPTNFIRFTEHIKDYQTLAQHEIARYKVRYCSEKNSVVEIKLGGIKIQAYGKTLLYEFVAPYGYSSKQLDDIYDSVMSRASGKEFFSNDYRIVLDRTSLFIVPKITARQDYLVIDKVPKQFVLNNYVVQCSIVPRNELVIHTSPRYAYVDLDKLTFPLMLRYWKQADYFYPYGLGKSKNKEKIGKKKLSKYFKDEKFSLLEKENTPILFSGDKVVWLLGHRLDGRFAVTENTKNILKMVIVDMEKENKTS